ncbi:uncharacterized protein MEPE_03064 [Melanopsichium pennsylvanicum]|uniref:Uncharacterized protein n=1 Tax=Melanopsichium pennsylvanicum TaxID=63383 RepID=A0AAJ4XLG5_9BASI|nr:uncharacterized protein MEPE_03064 [Melanopsichium pennsylvanicum]
MAARLAQWSKSSSKFIPCSSLWKRSRLVWQARGIQSIGRPKKATEEGRLQRDVPRTED